MSGLRCGVVAYGVHGGILIQPGASPHSFGAGSYRYEFEQEAVQKRRRFLSTQGITGLRRRLASRVREGCYYTYGKLVLYPSAGYFEQLLPFLVGAKGVYPAATTFTPGTCLSPFGLMIDRDKEVWTYSDCVVAAWELSGSAPKWKEEGNPDLMRLTIHMICGDETKGSTWPVNAPDIPETGEFTPYVLQDLDGRFKVDSTAHQMYDFHFIYDNMVEVKYAMSLTPSSITSTGLRIGLSGKLPWSTANDPLYPLAYTGESCEFKFETTVGALTHSTLFEIHNLKIPGESPFIKDSGVVQFSIEGEGYGDENTPELTVTNTIDT